MFDIIGMQTITIDVDPVRAAEIPSTDAWQIAGDKLPHYILFWGRDSPLEFNRDLWHGIYSAKTNYR